MSFLSKALGSLSFSSSAFSRGPQIEQDPQYPSIWQIYEGTVKKDKRPCTLFEFDGSTHNADHYRPLAENFLTLLRTMMIPGVLKIIDSEESGSNILIAVEPVKPIHLKLKDSALESRMWGLQSIYNTLAALHTHVKCVHGNINMGTVFETDTGEWVLGGLEIAAIGTNDTSSVSLTNGAMLPSAAAAVVNQTGSKASWLPSEVTRNGWGSLGRNAVLVDSYEFGYLASQVLRAPGASGSLKPSQSLISFVQALMGSQRQAITDPANSAPLNTAISTIAQAMESIMMINDYDMLKLLRFIDAHRQELPKRFVGGKVLPQIIQVTQGSKGGAEAVFVVLRLCLSLDEDQFVRSGLKYVLSLYKSMDRAIRIELLKSMPSYIDMVPKSAITAHILPAMTTGFADQEILVRQESLRVVPILAKKISSSQLEQQLLRSLARINTDKEACIRAQFVRVLAEIAELMTPATKSSVVVMALSRALGDPSVQVRIAAIETLGETVESFGPAESTKKLLGPAAAAMLDITPTVRATARDIVNKLVKKIEAASLEMDRKGVTGPAEPVSEPPSAPTSGSSTPKPDHFSSRDTTLPTGIHTENSDYSSQFSEFMSEPATTSTGWDAWSDPVEPIAAPQLKPLKPTDARILQPTRLTPIQVTLQPLATKPKPKPRAVSPPTKSTTPNFLDPVEDDDNAEWEW